MKKTLLIKFIFLFLFAITNNHLSYANSNLYSTKAWKTIFKQKNITNHPIIFIHGIAGGFQDWDKTTRLISNSRSFEMRYLDNNKIFHNYYPPEQKNWIWNISYYTNDPISESLAGDLSIYSQRLKKILQKISKITKKKKFILIAHSMGGLIARKYMTLDKKCWDSVHKVLTIGTPHMGVETSISIVGQLRDLRPESKFITKLNKDWKKFKQKSSLKKWGVIAGITEQDLSKVKPYSTDGAGLGYITISSAIPFGEWQQATEKSFKKPSYNTTHFGFRSVAKANHVELLNHKKTLAGIHWAVQK
ncbi:esterase/lipase family protein [Candidatus Margulisiibacteriota bacterium]